MVWKRFDSLKQAVYMPSVVFRPKDLTWKWSIIIIMLHHSTQFQLVKCQYLGTFRRLFFLDYEEGGVTSDSQRVLLCNVHCYALYKGTYCHTCGCYTDTGTRPKIVSLQMAINVVGKKQDDSVALTLCFLEQLRTHKDHKSLVPYTTTRSAPSFYFPWKGLSISMILMGTQWRELLTCLLQQIFQK